MASTRLSCGVIPCPRHVVSPTARRWNSSSNRPPLFQRPSSRSAKKPIDRKIFNDFALLRDTYDTPKHTIVLAHGLFGFSTLPLGPLPIAPLHYWHGIVSELTSRSIRVITTSVPPSASIQTRANHLARQIAQLAPDTPVSIIAHSMGGLDARCLISTIQPKNVDVRALVTIATPHWGSPVADVILEPDIKALAAVPRMLYPVLWRVGLGTDAFEQLTTRYMRETFNPLTPDLDGVRYFLYGATTPRPSLVNPFWLTHRVVRGREGANDGLVSVGSSRWGKYQGTLVDVSHLDLINWTNMFERGARRVLGTPDGFNAAAFYLGIADMLAKEGL